MDGPPAHRRLPVLLTPYTQRFLAGTDSAIQPAHTRRATGAGWGAGEGGSFEWREGNTISEGIGVPAIVPPTARYESAPNADILRLTLSEPVAIQAWELTYIPWWWYEEDPPASAASTEWHGNASNALALCIPAGEPGEYSLTADLDFGEGDHATYRWHVVIPAG